jgi:hypothetical protein
MQEVRKIVFDDIIVFVHGNGEELVLNCDQKHDAITTLLNLMSGLKAQPPLFNAQEGLANYENLMNGNGFRESEAFWARQLSHSETSSNEQLIKYKCELESLRGAPVNERFWLCHNDWNDTTNFLSESTFKRIVRFAYLCYSEGKIPWSEHSELVQ